MTVIRKKAVTNLMNRLIKRLSGIMNATFEDLQEAGLNTDKISKIGYRKGKTMSKEGRDLRNDLREMLLKITQGDEKKAKAKLKELSSFKGKDDEIISAETPEQLTSEKWVKSVYGKVKKLHEETFGSEESEGSKDES